MSQSEPNSNTESRSDILANIRKLAAKQFRGDDPMTIAQTEIGKMFLVAAMRHMKGQDPDAELNDIAAIIHAVTMLIESQGTDSTLLHLGQLAALAQCNIGGCTYGLISQDDPAGNKEPIAVQFFANRKLPPDQIAEILLRSGEKAKS